MNPIKTKGIYSQIVRLLLAGFLVGFAHHKVYSQYQDSLKFLVPNTNMQEKLLPINPYFYFPTFASDFSDVFVQNTNIWEETISFQKLNKPSSNFSFTQSRTDLNYRNLGISKRYMIDAVFHPTKRLKVELATGIIQQNSVLSAWEPNFQMVFKSLLEYEITPWLSGYIYGQYVSPSLNQSKFSDPLQFMNPMFLQNEVGGGLRAKYKNIKADVGMNTILKSKLHESNSKGYFNSKITVGF